MMGSNVEHNLVIRAADLMDVNVGTLPFPYLGTSLGDNPRRRNFWAPIIEKMRLKLGLWGSNFLSLSGRMVVLKAVLSAIPIYQMSLFLAPVGVVSDMEKLMRGFLWGKRNGSKGIPWIAWEEICKNSQMGGLGLGFLGWRNKALIIKWAWRFGADREALWRRALCAKYGWDDRRMLLHSLPMISAHLSIYFQDIMKVLMEDTIIAKAFREDCFCGVGIGSNTRIWKDPWIETNPLQIRFPRLFALSENKDAMVNEVGTFSNGKWDWSLQFRRRLFTWELDLHNELMKTLSSTTPSE